MNLTMLLLGKIVEAFLNFRLEKAKMNSSEMLEHNVIKGTDNGCLAKK